jgi:hypothetical protein
MRDNPQLRKVAWTLWSWLRGLGLGKYEALFHENDIDDTVVLTCRRSSDSPEVRKIGNDSAPPYANPPYANWTHHLAIFGAHGRFL